MPSCVHFGTVQWNGVIDNDVRQRLIRHIMSGNVATLKIEIPAVMANQVVNDLAQPAGKDHRAMWNQWREQGSSSSNMQPMLTQIYKNEDRVAYDFWQSIQRALGSTGDPTLEQNLESDGEYLGSSTIVGGILVGGKSKSTKPHWHAPPVINLHMYGETQKQYKFIKWEDMENDMRSNLQLTEKDMPVDITAEIGHGLEANCIIFPPGCLHFITTVKPPLTAERLKQIQDECRADDVDMPPEATAWTEKQAHEFFESGGKTLPRIGAGFPSESQQKNLYLGVGAYFVFADPVFVKHAIARMQEALKYESWTKQLDPKIANDMCRVWARSVAATNRVFLDPKHDRLRIKQTAPGQPAQPRNTAHIRTTVNSLLAQSENTSRSNTKGKRKKSSTSPRKQRKSTESIDTAAMRCYDCKKLLAKADGEQFERWIIGCEHVGADGTECPNWSCEACSTVLQGFGNDPTEKWFCKYHGGPLMPSLCYHCQKVLVKADGTQVEHWMIGCEHVEADGTECPNWSCETCSTVLRGFGNDPAEKWFCEEHGGPVNLLTDNDP